MLIVIRTFLLFITFFLHASLCYGESKVLKLGTASEGGNYFRLGQSIRQQLLDKGYEVDVLPTKGSVENVQMLADEEIDLAIVQNDIAFFGEYGLYPFKARNKSFSSVIPFYIEPIYIIVDDSNIRKIKHLEGRLVNVGEMGSGLYADALIILKSNGIWNNIERKTLPPGQISKLFEAGEIDAAFVNSFDEKIINRIKNGELFVLSLSNAETSSLESTFPYFSEKSMKINGIDVTTITVKSILVAGKNLPKEDIYTITKTLHENFQLLDFPNENTGLLDADVISSMPVKKWHDGAKKYYIEKRIVRSQLGLQILWILFSIVAFLLITVALMNLFFLIISKKYAYLVSTQSRMFNVFRNLNIYLLKHKYALIVIGVLTFFLIDLMIIQKVEHDWAVQNNVVCKYDNRSFVDNIIWLFVFGGSGYYGDIFPQSSLGKTLAALIPLIGFSGILTILGVFTSEKIKNSLLEARGVKTKMVEEHIIVCGFNRNVPDLIKNLIDDRILRNKRRHVILLAKLGESNPLYKYGLDNEHVGYINGEATNRNDLDRANLATADIAVIVSDDGADDQDARNILKILTVEKYCKELVKSRQRDKNIRDIYTVAEIEGIDSFQLARDANVDEIISFGGLRSKILAQSVLNPGVSCFINEILTFNDFNETYSMVVGEFYGKLKNKTFDELLFELRTHNILLLSINISKKDGGSPCEHVGSEDSASLRKVITNPLDEKEKAYEVKEGDVLIVLAREGRVIEQAKKNLSK